MRTRVISVMVVAGAFILWLGYAPSQAKVDPPDTGYGVERLIAVSSATPARVLPTAASISMTLALAVSVVDGDTIDVKLPDGQVKRLRYIGVSAPEDHANVCFGHAATTYNLTLVQGKQVWLERDVSETDKYGRLLRYVYLLDGRIVNEELVRAGYAQVTTYPPDVRYAQRFLAIQREARSRIAGLWGVCDSTAVITATPSPTTKGVIGVATCPKGCVVPPQGCTIKGNISKSGEKIYHVPGQTYYEQTKISPEYGERWFCTDAEALANGWRKALR
jgi:micrococcal nuclease